MPNIAEKNSRQKFTNLMIWKQTQRKVRLAAAISGVSIAAWVDMQAEKTIQDAAQQTIQNNAPNYT